MRGLRDGLAAALLGVVTAALTLPIGPAVAAAAPPTATARVPLSVHPVPPCPQARDVT